MSKGLQTLCLLFLSIWAYGQNFAIKGTITNENDEPIELVNVYISGSTFGTVTNRSGVFLLTNIQPGKYDLILSHVNHEVTYLPIEVNTQSIDLGTIKLKEVAYDLTTVEVNQREDKKWKRYFKRFKNFLLGDHFKNRSIDIPDSYNADFEVDGRIITEAYPFQVNIINTYTGYEIFYAVEKFQLDNKGPQFILGYPRFTPLQANDSDQEAKWEQNRFNAYKGSLRHFFKALITDELEANGFKAELTNTIIADIDENVSETNRFTVKSEEAKFKQLLTIEKTSSPGILRLKFKDYLRIFNTEEMSSNRLGQESMVHSPEGFIDVYETGIPVNPAAFYTYGYLATEGLYEMLPTDYSFTDAKEVVSNSEDPLAFTAEQLFSHVTQFPVEKVYLHLAKPYLAYNEVMWFQAYVLAGPEHIPTTLSQNLRVELLDEKLNLITDQELFIENGMAVGDFLISDTLSAGTFYLRAYTDWMLNFDEEFIALRKFEIVDKIDSAKNSMPPPTLRFFPEGGDLVVDLNSRVAFETNLPGAVKGEVRNSKNELISEFSGIDGYGSFFFKPKNEEQYFAVIEGAEAQFEFPKAKENGVVLSVKNDLQNGQLYMALSTNEPIRNKTGHFLIHTRGLIQYYEKIDWNDQAISLNVPTKVLADGLSHLTYFDENMLPQAERLIFKNENEKIQLSMEVNKNDFSLREKTEVTISVNDFAGIGKVASASVSVIDYNQINPDEAGHNIVSSLWLSSDIAGGIENSLQYVEGDVESLDKLDLILLTKGWRRFKWGNIQNDQFEITYLPKVGFSVSGKVFGNRGKKPLEDQSLLHMSQFNGQGSFQESITTAEGAFDFDELKYFEGSSFLQMNNIKNGTRLSYDELKENVAGLPIYKPFYRELRINNAEETIKKTQLSETQELLALLDSTYYRDLGTVVVEATRFDEVAANQERGQLYKAGRYSYSVTDMMKSGSYFRTPLHVLLGRMPGFTMINRIGDPLNPYVKMDRRDEGIVANTNPSILFMIDDGRVTLQDVMMLNPVRIDRIEVMKASQAFHLYGSEAGGGLVAIYTKTREELVDYNKFMSDKADSKKDFDQFILPGGYYSAREFYSPDYSIPDPDHARTDYRNIIHWETKIRTNEDGKYAFSFYNADIPTEVMILLEGITDQGEPFTATAVYNVNAARN